MTERTPSCFDCLQAKIDPGYSATQWEPGEPASAECQHDQYYELQEEQGEAIAPRCPGFNPVQAGRCACCQTNIPAALYMWRLFAPTLDDSVVVCSEQCKESIEGVTKAEEERDRLLESQYDQWLYEQEQAAAIESELNDDFADDFAYDCYRDRQSTRRF